MKVRLWYQEYIPATAAAAPSHQQLYRMYHSIAGEYDVVKQDDSHSRKDVNGSNIQVNEFKFKARDMTRPGNTRARACAHMRAHIHQPRQYAHICLRHTVPDTEPDRH